MVLYLEPPSNVVVVDPGGSLDEFVERLGTHEATDSNVVESVTDAREAVAADTDIVPPDSGQNDAPAGLVAATVTDELVDLVATLADERPGLPVVVTPQAADDGRLADATLAGARHIPRSTGQDALAEAVVRAVERYGEQWIDEQARTALESMLREFEVPIYAKDRDGRHVMAPDVTGAPAPQDYAGKTDKEVWGDDDYEETFTDDQSVVEDGVQIQDQIECDGIEPALYWGRTTKVPWRDADGSIQGLVGISEDITGLKQTERALRNENERLKQFVDFLSHDLRNPLQVAIGHLELAKDGGDEQSLVAVENALNRMEEMLDDISETAQANDNINADLEDVTPLSIEEVVTDVWSPLETESATVELSFPGRATIEAPEHAVRPVFENLLKNAVAHGGDDVTVTVGPLSDGFYVADDGPGIPEDERDKVTEEGYTTATDGTGTGLSIVSEVAGEQGWDFEITESESGGAQFEFHNAMVVPSRPATAAKGLTTEIDEATDIGTIEAGERASYDSESDRWTVEASGSDIWRHVNDFYFVYAAVSDDVRLEGRVCDLDAVSEYTKAGFMVRNGTTEDATYGYVGRTGGHGAEVLWRLHDGEPGVSQILGSDAGDFEYFRVERVGDTVTCSVSEDGHEWIAVDQRPVAFDGDVCAGLAVCSNIRREPTTAVFEDVTITHLATTE